MNDLRLPLLADGDVAGFLKHGHARAQAGGLGLALIAPQAVKKAHQAFAQAGATLLRTHTRDAHQGRLQAEGLGEKCEALHAGAAGLAKEVAGEALRVMGDLGPMVSTGGLLGARPVTGWEMAFSERAIYLSDAGVDVFVLSHFSRVAEAVVATRMVKRTSDAPVLAQLRFPLEDPEAEGLPGAMNAAQRLLDEGADALGISCQAGPLGLEALAHALLRLSAPTGVPVGVFVGLAEFGGDAQAWAEGLARLARDGVAMVGGCCGVGPEHTAMLAAKLDELG